MTDKLLPDAISPAPILSPTLSPLPVNIDEGLLLTATARWRDSSLGLNALFANVPIASGSASTYWHARAPGTPLSRRDRAVELYGEYCEAVAQVAFAKGTATPPLAKDITDLLRQPAHLARTTEFALPPTLEQTPNINAYNDQPALFGALYADVPWSVRQAALDLQRQALDRYLGEELESARHQQIAERLSDLETAGQSADQAASALLYRERVLDTATINHQFTALYQAHKAGLRAEIELQRALEQLTEDEYHLIKNLLEQPDDSAPDANTMVASLVLTATKADQTSHELSGPWVIKPSGSSPHTGLLLYWPGSGGGLQRFANQQALEREVFKIHDADEGLALRLNPIGEDPLQYSLNQLTDDFEANAAQIRQRPPGDSRAAQLEDCRRQALAHLQVPVHAARSLMFSQRLEQNRSATLATNLPDWLRKKEENIELKGLIEAYIQAMHRSHEQLEIALMPRKDFTRQRLHARLKKDFAIKGDFQVLLDLPDSVSWQKQSIPAPGAPGTPQKLALIPSTARSKMALEDLAQLNIDNTPSMNLEPLLLRLSFMKVEVGSTDANERQTLSRAITLPWLRKVLPELDLAQAYEALIRKTFMGADDEATFVSEHRRECLLEPWRLMLKLQGETARLQQQINSDELKVLYIAIDADTPQAWATDGKRIALWPAILSAGGKDTPNEGPVTLAGVTFIEERHSGMTLLYLPDSPDGQFLRRYDTLEAARKALFNLCLRDEMVSYLAGRALQGSVQAHASRINQAMLKHFDGMIALGTRWPATTSLAAHQLNTHMGRLIEAHRVTSRSNADLYRERYALQGPRAFNYMKMALGMVPFVGTALALYDAWNSANLAVSAFVRGEVGDGLAEVESVLLCLIDAAMDILPGIVVGPPNSARAATRTRQMTAMHQRGALQSSTLDIARRLAQRFDGYEYERPLSLAGRRPAAHGVYRNIYRHADGDFIVRQGRVFQVERSKDSRNWRLKGTTQKTFKQPIALDETGHWDTYFGVYGVAFEGGGLGGGNMLGHLADTLDPVWPQAIRERLPRWWVDETFRRVHALTQAADDFAPRIDARLKQTEATLAAYNEGLRSDRVLTLRQQAEAACVADIEMAGRYYQTLADLAPLTHGNKKRVLLDFQSDAALILADRFKQRTFLVNHRADELLDSIDALTDTLSTMPVAGLAQRLRVLEDIRKLRLEMLDTFDSIEAHLRELNHWYQRITINADKAKLTPEVMMFNSRLTEVNLLNLKTGHLLDVVTRFDTSTDLSWFFLQGQMLNIRERVERALFTQFSLPQVSATRAQRSQILQDCIEQYSEFLREMNAWTASYPQHFHLAAVPRLIDGLLKLTDRARKAINLPAPATPAGPSSKKVFRAENDQWLIGEERWEPTTRTHRYTLTGQRGYLETWELGANGKARLLNPPPQPAQAQPRNLELLLAEARQRLQSQDTYRGRVEAYANQDMLPVDLEHMMLSEAKELSRRALAIEELAPRDVLVQQLRDKASELIATGRRLRTRQSLASQNPTDGMLEDLLRQDAVEIRKTSPLKHLSKRKDGRHDFMQEYEIWDRTHTPPRVLWYAHFHYSKAAPAFGGFEKAHLKLPEHRFLTHADNAELPYADIGKKSAVLPYFNNL
ncbi:dermonecrotic toxin domain-containing protein [Pseudomonas sp. KK4]|uniref:dermonecrotic toxin domain-containing protein n=1 Tax=Pseudomonas sp. KK4 TaxID=1855729 RepID=UPI00097C10A1|nr:DUF6543 domain-containing protein [Pseudomonas sp. KK4]